MTNELDSLRKQIRQIDEEILSLSAKRIELARKIGKVKLDLHLPIKDFRIEKRLIESNRKLARDLELYQDLAEEVSRIMIKYSVMAQDEYHRRSKQRSTSDAKRITVVGGLGAMGLWITEFLAGLGHNVSVLDRDSRSSRFGVKTDLKAACGESDIIVLSTPITATARIIEEISAQGTKALVFDICSLKSPIMPALEQAESRGLRITSVHPMFGPSIDLLTGRNIVLCETANVALTEECAELFAETTANLIRMPLAKHDEMMGYVLGLSHMTSLAFAHVLDHSGLDFNALSGVASTSFKAQLDVTVPILHENQDLYYEIQSANAFTPVLLNKIKFALENYAMSIANEDRAHFKKLMQKSLEFIGKGI